MLAIEVKNLTKDFNGLRAIDNISFGVKEGEIFGLLGPNGAGKTTIIKILTTLLRPSKGEAKVWGYDISKQKDDVRNSVGIVFQEPALDNRLTGYENLDFHARIYGLDKDTRQKRIEEVLDLVELRDKANVLVKDFSGGMQRRLEIARGLMHYPKVLFLDEPTLGLDTQTRRHIWDYILKLNQKEKITIILTTHYMEEADYLCQRVAIIDFGKIVAEDTPENLKNILGGDVISIEALPSPKAFVLFQKLSWVKKISQYNSIIDLNVEQGEKKIPLLMKIDQKEAGFGIKSINLRKPTLEDVFLHFTGKTIREREVSQAERRKRMMR
jgi:ABC-2 type transport system ATP-binding protein